MASSYTDLDRKRPRTVRRGDENETLAPESIGHTQLMAIEKPGLFDGISIAQIAAGAAAAATSVVLASHIGIGGSVIGAAVSSVVTVVSSQIYRRFLDAGAEKIRRGGAAVREAASAAGEHVPLARASQTSEEALADPTTVIDGRSIPVRGARVAPAKLQARAATERKSTQRKVALFSIATAAVAVAGCALLIMLGTSGAGLGTKTQPLFSAPAAESPEASAADNATVGDSETFGGDTPSSVPSTDATADGGQTANTGTNAGATDSSSADPTTTGTDAGNNASESDTAAQGSGSAANTNSATGSDGSGNGDGDVSTGDGTDASTGSSSNSSVSGATDSPSETSSTTARN